MTVNHVQRMPRKRTYLLCPPAHFVVEYAINPWMDTTASVDVDLAHKQWDGLREALVRLGHDVHELSPEVGLPDMVYAANGAFVVDSIVYGARFKHPQRSAEAVAHRRFYTERSDHPWRFVPPVATNEGEGDFAYVPDAHGGIVLAGYGYRTEQAAHAEAQEIFGRPVISLKLTDPRFYHLDTALAAIDDSNIAYYPHAFSDRSRRVLEQLFPAAVIASEQDALAFGLNLVSDGRHVVLNSDATGLATTLAAAGYEPVRVDLSELKKGGGSVKCCIAELRH